MGHSSGRDLRLRQRAQAAWWAVRAVRRTARQLRAGQTGLPLALEVADVRCTRWVHAVVRSTPATCLARALVLQRWHLACGDPRDVVVAVTAPSRGFRAHAWLDGTPAPDGFVPLRRIPPPAA